MIYMCVQPDTPYFVWQLEVQLFNFKRLGVDLKRVHIIFAYGYEAKPSLESRVLQDTFPEVQIFHYADTRLTAMYIPSIRPNALKQHFQAYPWLAEEAIFYYDADILFRELPDFDKLLVGSTCYVSDTNSYLNSDYVGSKGRGFLEEFCDCAGVTVEQFKALNKDSGGAQYLLKNVDAAFWQTVEDDCERLYRYMIYSVGKWQQAYAEATGRAANEYHPIQAWTADMWAVLFGMVKAGKQVRVDPELNFSWATSPMYDLEKSKIFHNAGVTGDAADRLFFKGAFIEGNPFNVNLDYVSKEHCSRFYADEINSYVNSFKSAIFT